MLCVIFRSMDKLQDWQLKTTIFKDYKLMI